MAFPYYPTFPYQAPQQSGGIIWVQGIESMKSYPVSAGQSALLMDSESNCFGIKTVDASGMPHPLRVFDYVERKQPARSTESTSAASLDVSRFVTHEELEGAIRAILAQSERSVENAE